MAEIKDKVITVETLKVVHDYETKALGKKFNKTDTIPVSNGGTGATDGAAGLKNLFADGVTVLSSYQYGDTLPEAGTVGRIFFKRLTDV